MIEAIDDGVVTDGVTLRRYQRTIRAEVRRLGAMMDDFFELSRLESGAFTLRRERMALGDLLSDALEAAQSQAERQSERLEGQNSSSLQCDSHRRRGSWAGPPRGLPPDVRQRVGHPRR